MLQQLHNADGSIAKDGMLECAHPIFIFQRHRARRGGNERLHYLQAWRIALRLSVTLEQFAGRVAREMEGCFAILVLNVAGAGVGIGEEFNERGTGACTGGNVEGRTLDTVDCGGGFGNEIDEDFDYLGWRIEACAGV